MTVDDESVAFVVFHGTAAAGALSAKMVAVLS